MTVDYVLRFATVMIHGNGQLFTRFSLGHYPSVVCPYVCERFDIGCGKGEKIVHGDGHCYYSNSVVNQARIYG